MTAAQSDRWSTGNDISNALRSTTTLCYPCTSKSWRLGTIQTQSAVVQLACGVPWSPVERQGGSKNRLSAIMLYVIENTQLHRTLV